MASSKNKVAKTLLIAAGPAKFSNFLIEAQKPLAGAMHRTVGSQHTLLSCSLLKIPMNVRYGWRQKGFYQKLQNSTKNNNDLKSK